MTTWQVSEFQEVRELGRGAQGRVVLAQHHQTGTPVAIKYLPAEASEEDKTRFHHEARMLAQVQSPHVAKLYRLVESEHGTALVMEAVNGTSLQAVLETHGALPAEAALTVLKGSLLGLAAAHAVGVVHRDYKPANVIVPADGASKLIDFGIATPAGTASRAGTPYYMAPEQWENAPASPATDVYAATCVFFEAVTGQRPYPARERMALMRGHLLEPVPLEAVPPPLRAMVARGMAKQAEQRPAGAAAFVGELERTAQAAYGPDWESRGVQALAAAAVALAALFPLTAAGMAAQGVSVGTAAAGGAAKTGVVATLGAKTTLAVGTTAVVATGAAGVAAYEVTRPERPPAVRPISLTTKIHNEARTEINFTVQGAQYVAISGHRDQAVQRRINQALYQPIDDAIARYRQHWAQIPAETRRSMRQDKNGWRAVLKVTTRVGLRGPRLISVGYLSENPIYAGGGTDLRAESVTVDLSTGRVLDTAAVLRGAVLKPLSRRVLGPGTGGNPNCERPTLESDYGRVKPLRLPMVFTADGVEFGFAEANECSYRDWVKVPYAKIADLLQPEIAKAAQTRP